MAKLFKKLSAKFTTLPRSMRWLVVFLLGLALYFIVIEEVLDQTSAFNSRADALASGLKQEQELNSAESDKGKRLADGRRLFGEPLLPGDLANRPEALHRAVDHIMAKNGVKEFRKTERRTTIRDDEFAAMVGSFGNIAGKAERLIIDISFDAPPEAVTAIVSELEQAKEVALISKVDLRRPDAGRDVKGAAAASSARILKVTLSPEAWIVNSTASSSTPGRAGGGGR